MNFLNHVAASDSIMRWLIVLAVQITVVATVGLLGSAFLRRDAASRHAVLSISLIALLFCPLATWLFVRNGWALWEVAVPTNGRADANREPRWPVDSDDRWPISIGISDPLSAQRGLPSSTREPMYEEVAEESSSSRQPSPDTAAALSKTDLEDLDESSLGADRASSRVLNVVPKLGLTIWAGVLMLFVVRMIHGWHAVRRLVEQAAFFDRGQFADAVAQAESMFRPHRPLRILVSDRIGTAVALGLFRPTIIVPGSYVDTLSRDDLAAVLVHEAAHLVRRDPVIGLFQRVAEAIYWPHPLVHVINRRVGRAREEICDNYVLRRHDPRSYSLLLLRLVASSKGWTAPAGSFGFLNARWKFEDRVAGLLDSRRSRMVRPRRRLFAMSTILIGIVVMTFAGLRLIDRPEGDVVAAAPPTVNESLPAGAILRLGDNRFRHEGGKKDLGFSADGRTLVSCADNSLRFWDARTGKLIRETAFNDHVSRAMCMSPDRRRVASVGSKPFSGSLGLNGARMNASLCILDVETGAVVSRTLWPCDFRSEIHVGVPTQLAFTPDGAFVFVGDSDGYVQLWEVATGKRMLTYRVADLRDIEGLAVSPDGKLLAISSDSNELLLWDWQSGASPKVVGPRRRYLGLAFSPDGKILAAGGDTKDDVRLFDVATRAQIGSLVDSPDVPILAKQLAFTPDGKMLAAANSVGLIKRFVAAVLLWDVETGKLVKRVSGERMQPTALSISPDGKCIAAADWTAAMHVWQIATGESIGDGRGGHNGMVRAVRFSPNSNEILTACDDHTTRIWSGESGRQVGQLDHKSQVFALALSPDGRVAATGTQNDTVTIWDLASKTQRQTIKGSRSLGGAWNLTFSPDGSEILAAEDDLRLCAWQVADGKIVRDIQLRPSSFDKSNRMGKRGDENPYDRENLFGVINGYAFSGDASKLIIAGSEAYWIFDAKTGTEIGRHALPFRPLTVALCDDGKRVAFGGAAPGRLARPGSTIVVTEKSVKVAVFDLDSGKMLCETKVDGQQCRSIAFSHGGGIIAAVGRSTQRSTLEFFDAATGKSLHTITELRPTGWSDQGLAFSSDNKRLASVQEDATVLVWDVATLGDAVAHALGWASRADGGANDPRKAK